MYNGLDFWISDGSNRLKSSGLIEAAALATVSKQYISQAVRLDRLTVAGLRLTEPWQHYPKQ